MRYTYKERIWVIVLSVLSILGFFSFSLMDILGYVGREDTFDYSHYNLVTTYETTKWIVWLVMLLLLYFGIKGIYVSFKTKLKRKNIITVFFMIVLLLIFFVPFSIYVPRTSWTLLNFIGVCFMFSIIINIISEPSTD
ncbi:MAG: hypothetical protein GY756_01610 [bacterium]|nr:hypothetical protein [bacterium]